MLKVHFSITFQKILYALTSISRENMATLADELLADLEDEEEDIDDELELQGATNGSKPEPGVKMEMDEDNVKSDIKVQSIDDVDR